MVDGDRRCAVLNGQEQQVWDDVVRYWAEDAEEPPRDAPLSPAYELTTPQDEDALPLAVIVGARFAVLLVLIGLVPAGVALGVLTWLGWAIWRHGWRLTAQSAAR
jgi:hypothetical protein